MKSTMFAVVVAALLINNAESFSPSSMQKKSKISRANNYNRVLYMAAGDDKDNKLDGAQITSARKELRFDDKTGRFFETNLETEECIPDEEFCTIDEETGNRIRLTIAEKERIFLDALQVRKGYVFTRRAFRKVWVIVVVARSDPTLI
jgi:hypothetical protein